MEINYLQIFNQIESGLREHTGLDLETFEHIYRDFKTMKFERLSDAEYFRRMTMVVFYSGFSARKVEIRESNILKVFPDHTTVNNYTARERERILSDAGIIRHPLKIASIFQNAMKFGEIIDVHGSFHSYIDSFNARDFFENLMLLKEELEANFGHLGGVTVYHFLTDIGFDVIKPDRAIVRIFERLNLIEHRHQYLKVILQARKFSSATKYSLRYIDIIFAKYGQEGETERFSQKNGICLERNPFCHKCKAFSVCKYSKKSLQ